MPQYNKKPRAKSRNRNSSHRRKPKSTIYFTKLKKIALIAAIPMAVLSIGGFALTQSMKVERPDQYGCYDRSNQAVSAIAIDSSLAPNLSPAQLRDYTLVLKSAYDDALPNARIDIFTTARDVSSSIAKPVASACKPAATPQELERLKAPAQTAPLLKRQAEEAVKAFETIIAQVLADVQAADKTAKDSPLFSTLQGISRYKGFTGDNRSLIWITDGIVNSEIARFCVVKGDLPPFENFRRQTRYQHIAPTSFNGTDVKIMLVESVRLPSPYAPYCTNNEIRRFWPDYFTGNGANSVELQILRHGAQ